MDVLQQSLLPFIAKHNEPVIFQQDDAPCHNASATKNWLAERDMSVMKWPARSPDLNPIENVWGIMTRDVYACSKQYNTCCELEDAIVNAWMKVERQWAVKLRDSMHKRCIEVLERGGMKTGY